MVNVDRFVNQIKPYVVPMLRSRMGSKNDGGYIVLPELLNEASFLYSYGIGDDVGFEKDFINSNKSPESRVMLFDPTIDAPPEEHPKFIFNKVGIEKNLWGVAKNSVVKIDVEGAEWGELARIRIEELQNWSQLIIELHLVHAEPPVVNTPYFKAFYEKNLEAVNNELFFQYWLVLRKLNSAFYMYHIHPNNSLPLINVGGHAIPPLLEMSFVRKDLVTGVTPILIKDCNCVFDAPNKTDRPDIKLEDIK